MLDFCSSFSSLGREMARVADLEQHSTASVEPACVGDVLMPTHGAGR